jgi:hypothetical protein
MKLRALGFCGADDSVHPHHLVILAKAYPLVEFGILFRPDLEGQPRYASTAWVEQLAKCINKEQFSPGMKLAAHLCGSRVNDALEGKGAPFLEQLQTWGFGRVQINATAVNGVDTSRLVEAVPILLALIQQFPTMEFILQQNDETQPLWEGLLQQYSATTEDEKVLPHNVSMLLDESKGTGVLRADWPTPPTEYDIGYAGGMGPDNIDSVLEKIKVAAAGRSIWIDMESRLRSIKNDKDIFDLDKCYTVIDAVCKAGLQSHPDYLTPS